MADGRPKKSSSSRWTDAGAATATKAVRLPFLPPPSTLTLAWLCSEATRASTASTSLSNAVASGAGVVRTSARGGHAVSARRNIGQRRLFMAWRKTRNVGKPQGLRWWLLR
jgi:hypothetical protein